MYSLLNLLFQPVLSVEIVLKGNIYGYNGNKKHPFLKITVAEQKMIAKARRLLEEGNVGDARGYQTYESNMDFEVNKLPIHGNQGNLSEKTTTWDSSGFLVKTTHNHNISTSKSDSLAYLPDSLF